MGNSFDPTCVEANDSSRIKLEEYGRKVIFLNPANDTYNLTRIDGCVIKQGARADWLVSCGKAGHAVVELKGKDVGHAVEQVEATLKYLKSKNLIEGSVAAIIMCKQVPKALTSLQTSTARIRKVYGARLKVSSSIYEFTLSDVVSKS